MIIADQNGRGPKKPGDTRKNLSEHPEKQGGEKTSTMPEAGETAAQADNAPDEKPAARERAGK